MSGGCLIDSSAFLSLEDVDEVSHAAALDAYRGLVDARTPLMTTNFVFDETYTLLLTRLGRQRAVAWGDRLLGSAMVRLMRVSRQHEEQAWDIIRNHEDESFSYTDATCFAVAEDLCIETALALDRHFVQYGRLQIVP